jgi:hypothetical protein
MPLSPCKDCAGRYIPYLGRTNACCLDYRSQVNSRIQPNVEVNLSPAITTSPVSCRVSSAPCLAKPLVGGLQVAMWVVR